MNLIKNRYSLEEFNRICDQIGKLGLVHHENLKLTKSKGQYEIQAPRCIIGCFIRLISYFYKPKECRFANVHSYVLELFQKHEDYIEGNLTAYKALRSLNNKWQTNKKATSFHILFDRVFIQKTIQLQSAAQKLTAAANQTLADAKHISEVLEKKEVDALKDAKLKLETELKRTEANSKEIETAAKHQANLTRQQAYEYQQATQLQAKQRLDDAEERAKEITFKAQQALNKEPLVATVNNLGTLLLKTPGTMDCTIMCRGGSVKAHWSVLSTIEFFMKAKTSLPEQAKEKQGSLDVDVKQKNAEKTFDLAFSERDNKDHAAIVGFTLETVTTFINYVYMRRLDIVEIGSIFELVRLADFIGYKDLELQCLNSLKKLIRKNPYLLYEFIPKLLQENNSAVYLLLEEFIDINDWLSVDNIPRGVFNAFTKILKEKSELENEHPAIRTAYAALYYRDSGPTALNILKKPLEVDYAPAQCLAAYIYGAQKNEAESKRLTSLSAAQGWCVAICNVGSYSSTGSNGMTKDTIAAKRYYQSVGDNLTAEFRILLLEMEEAKTKEEKLHIIGKIKLLAGHYPKVQNYIGIAYLNGDYVTKDMKEANHWFKLAAQNGYAVGYCNLALTYERGGEGLAVDQTKANELFVIAANKGIMSSCYYLGLNYEKGKGFTANREKAIEWYKKGQAECKACKDALTRLGVPLT